MVDGKFLQTNKKYSHLKLKQKEKIHQWMYESYRDYYLETRQYPNEKDCDSILEPVLYKIIEADIWIPDYEVYKHYRKVVGNLRKRLRRELSGKMMDETVLEPLDITFSVCQVEDYSMVDIDRDFCFTGKTDEEKSLVCPVDMVPDNTIARDDGWKCFRICGVLDFSLIGILARISKILASNQIGIFAISTYNTDYILTKEKDFNKALQVLKNSGYRIKGA